MIPVLFIILSLILLIIGFIVMLEDGFLIMVFLVLASAAQIPNAIAYTEAINDVAYMKQIDNKITVVKEEIGVLGQELDNLSPSQTKFTMNADSPVAAMVKARTEMKQQMINWKNGKISMKQTIFANCLGLMSWVRTTFVDGYCELAEET